MFVWVLHFGACGTGGTAGSLEDGMNSEISGGQEKMFADQLEKTDEVSNLADRENMQGETIKQETVPTDESLQFSDDTERPMPDLEVADEWADGGSDRDTSAAEQPAGELAIVREEPLPPEQIPKPRPQIDCSLFGKERVRDCQSPREVPQPDGTSSLTYIAYHFAKIYGAKTTMRVIYPAFGYPSVICLADQKGGKLSFPIVALSHGPNRLTDHDLLQRLSAKLQAFAHRGDNQRTISLSLSLKSESSHAPQCGRFHEPVDIQQSIAEAFAPTSTKAQDVWVHFLWATVEVSQLTGISTGVFDLHIAYDGDNHIIHNAVAIQDRSGSKLRLLQLTDVHVEKDNNVHQQIREVVDAIKPLQPEMVMLTGDVNDIGSDEADNSTAGRTLISQIDAPLLIIPGNHDHFSFSGNLTLATTAPYDPKRLEALTKGLTNFFRAFHPFLTIRLYVGDTLYIGLDTGPSVAYTNQISQWRNTSEGITFLQMESLKNYLQQAAQESQIQRVMLLGHTPPVVEVTGSVSNIAGFYLRASEMIREINKFVSDHGKALFYVSGHTHWNELLFSQLAPSMMGKSGRTLQAEIDKHSQFYEDNCYFAGSITERMIEKYAQATPIPNNPPLTDLPKQLWACLPRKNCTHTIDPLVFPHPIFFNVQSMTKTCSILKISYTGDIGMRLYLFDGKQLKTALISGKPRNISDIKKIIANKSYENPCKK
jgi:hypothetical protein